MASQSSHPCLYICRLVQQYYLENVAAGSRKLKYLICQTFFSSWHISLLHRNRGCYFIGQSVCTIWDLLDAGDFKSEFGKAKVQIALNLLFLAERIDFEDAAVLNRELLLRPCLLFLQILLLLISEIDLIFRAPLSLKSELVQCRA